VGHLFATLQLVLYKHTLYVHYIADVWFGETVNSADINQWQGDHLSGNVREFDSCQAFY